MTEQRFGTRATTTEAIQAMLIEFQAARANQPEPWLDVDLSMLQLRTLFLLDYLGAIRVGALAQKLQLSANATTSLLDHLEDAALVARHADRTDRRAVLVDLTDAGTAVIGDLRNVNARQMGRRLERLSMEELSAFHLGMTGLLRAIHEEQGDVAASA